MLRRATQTAIFADFENHALVVGVKRGSIAQKSGIIVGDILYGLDGRPLKALPDAAAELSHSPGYAGYQ